MSALVTGIGVSIGPGGSRIKKVCDNTCATGAKLSPVYGIDSSGMMKIGSHMSIPFLPKFMPTV